MNYLERYLDGEYDQVWKELVAQGSSIRYEPFAHAISKEIMRRARYNIQLLIDRLSELEYIFKYPHRIWTPPTDDLHLALHTVETHYGTLPQVLHMWFREVGEVNFIGAHPRLSSYYGLLPPDKAMHAPTSDPLQIIFYGVLVEESQEDGPYISTSYSVENIGNIAGVEREEYLHAQFEFSTNPSHKANRSGSGMKSMPLTDTFDAWIYTGTHRESYFIPYLRTCFAWGGFPGLQTKPEAAAAAREELAFLTKDLLPI